MTHEEIKIIAETLIKTAATLGAVAAIWAVAYKIIKWFQRQEKQTSDIEALRNLHENDTKELQEKENADMQLVKDELCILSYAMLAALDGLKQQGCNGEVTKAHNMLEKHLNKRAHD